MSVPPAKPVEAVGEVDAVGRGHDRERGEDDERPRLDRDVAQERHRQRSDVVGRLDLVGDEQARGDLPQQLLADADPLAGRRVEVVVEGAQATDEQQGEDRRDGLRAPEGAVADDLEEQRAGRDDDDHQDAAHRWRAFLDEVRLRPLLADALAQAQAAQQHDERRHQDDHQGERQEDALDDAGGDRHATVSGWASATQLVDEVEEALAVGGLEQDDVTVAQDVLEPAQRDLAVARDVRAVRVHAGGLGRVGVDLRRPGRRPSARPPSWPRTRRPRCGSRRCPDPARASRRGPRRGARAGWRGDRARRPSSRAPRCTCRRGSSSGRSRSASCDAARRSGRARPAAISSRLKPAVRPTAAAASALWTLCRPSAGMVTSTAPPWARSSKRMPVGAQRRDVRGGDVGALAEAVADDVRRRLGAWSAMRVDALVVARSARPCHPTAVPRPARACRARSRRSILPARGARRGPPSRRRSTAVPSRPGCGCHRARTCPFRGPRPRPSGARRSNVSGNPISLFSLARLRSTCQRVGQDLGDLLLGRRLGQRPGHADDERREPVAPRGSGTPQGQQRVVDPDHVGPPPSCRRARPAPRRWGSARRRAQPRRDERPRR